MKETMKDRVIRDPIHGFVNVPGGLIQKLVSTEYFQRLRRLYQLGMSPLVYPTATHSRLSHSLGAMELFTRIHANLHKGKDRDTDNRLETGQAAILLHDLGHGPLSHASEDIFGFKHEDLTVEIIKNTEIKDILGDGGVDFNSVIGILQHNPKPDLRYVSQLISSQLDVDRLDYLARDAYFTGVSFVGIDLQRIIRTLEIYQGKEDIDGHVVISNKGLASIEAYILGRHLMYQNVYYHKTTRCFESILQSIFTRVWDMENGESKFPTELEFLACPGKLSFTDMLELDDHAIYSLIKQWKNDNDPTLGDLSSRIINRRPLKSIDVEEPLGNKHDKIKEILERKSCDPKYYMLFDSPTNNPYSPYSLKAPEDNDTTVTNIFILDACGKPKEISQRSKVVRALAENQTKSRMYVPEECIASIRGVLQQQQLIGVMVSVRDEV